MSRFNLKLDHFQTFLKKKTNVHLDKSGFSSNIYYISPIYAIMKMHHQCIREDVLTALKISPSYQVCT